MTIPREHCRLSVVLVTYNHERYVGQALRSLFGQEFDEPVELIVADDGSTDQTVALIKASEGADPRFRFVYPDDSAHRGVTGNYRRALAACGGDYVALLEGDDYWTSPRKLRLQRDFLDQHWECDLCAVNYYLYEEDTSRFAPLVARGRGYRLFDARDVIADNPVGNFSVCMYRKTALDALPEGLFELESYDWIVNLCIARTSLIGFLSEPMSVYRRHEGGVWSRRSDIEKLTQQLQLIPAYDELTERLFHKEFEALARRLRYGIKLKASAQSGWLSPALRVFMETYPRSQRLPDFVPPAFMAVGRAMLPPAIRRRVARVLHESRPG